MGTYRKVHVKLERVLDIDSSLELTREVIEQAFLEDLGDVSLRDLAEGVEVVETWSDE